MEAVGDGGMTRLYLIRHAEAEGNLYRVAHGHCNGLITNYRGYQQIDALRERFRKVDIDAVYSSDLYRTQITARAIWLPKALPLHLEPAFREICMGEWEDHTWHELNVKYPEEMYNFNRRADLWRVPGAETAQQVVDRFIPALERVARAHEGGTAAVFSHGMALRTVLGVLQESKAEEAIEAVTAYRGEGEAKARRTNRNVKERWNLDISDWQTSDLPPLHKFHKKTLVCIRRILRVLVRCAEKSFDVPFDVPNVYMIRRNIL